MIDSQAFNQQLLSDNPPVLDKTYFFHGQTPILSEENAQNLMSYAKKKGYTHREIFYIDNRTKFQPILDVLQSPGLFDPKKIMELRFDTPKPTKKIGEQILKISQHQTDNLCIIQAGSLNYEVQREKWFKEITQKTNAVLAKPIYPNQLPNWIHQRATQLNLSLETDALKTIMRFSEGNLLWTNQILMQLSHSDYPQPIKEDLITQILSDMSVFQIDDLMKAVLAKQNNALSIIEKLKQENQPLVLLTSVLYRDIDSIHNIMTSGKPFALACKDLRIWPSKQKQLQTAINYYSHEQLHQALKHLAQLDRINKGVEKGDGWLLLTKTVSDLLFNVPAHRSAN